MSDSDSPNNPRKQPMTGRQTYNLVTDTVAGPNVRLKDNLLQGLTILVCLILGCVIGYLVPTNDRAFGAIVGGFAGVLVGLFGSGIFLMIDRAMSHMRKRHD